MKYQNYGLTLTKLGPLLCFCSFFTFVRTPKIADQKYQCINNNYLKIVWLILTKWWLIFNKIITQMVLFGVFEPAPVQC